MHRFFVLGPAVACILAAACEPPAEPEPAHLAIVYGQVVDAQGSVVPNAVVFATADQSGECPAVAEEYLNPGPFRAETDSFGRYRALAQVLTQVSTSCVRVVIAPPAGAGLGRASVSSEQVRFGMPAYDSVRVDVVLLRQ